MHYGISLPNFGTSLDARELARLAREAEQAGWDGFFIWDHLLAFAPGPVPVVDPWVALTAIALATERMRIGPMATPLPRRRPTTLARQTVSVDHVSNGRLVLAVGIGALPYEWDYLGEESDLKRRGAMLDEGLDVLTGLWSGELFSYHGTHYTIAGKPPDAAWQALFYPPPVQTPRIPVWIGGTWPHKRPFRRAAHWDGVCPTKQGGPMLPQDVRDMMDYIAPYRVSTTPFEVVIAGETPGHDLAQSVEHVAPFEAAGATWWIEGIHPWRFGWDSSGPWPGEPMRERILQGPPRSIRT
jgi:alkanesulfonate monooxygenase SsuD/methylene tetrahydromethanopterin reductase-like flavin-dependent oxidoreductase (luciferase family)